MKRLLFIILKTKLKTDLLFGEKKIENIYVKKKRYGD
jgi:hypothetical protein